MTNVAGDTTRIGPAGSSLVFAVFLISIFCSACGGSSDPSDLLPAVQTGAEARKLSGITRHLISPYLKYKVAGGTRSGFAVLAARDGQLQYSAAVGYSDIATKRPMTATTRVRIASMAKPITGVAALQLIEQGRLGLNDPVVDYIPSYARLRVAEAPAVNAAGDFSSAPISRPLTIRDLLDFRAGMGDSMALSRSELDQLWGDWREDDQLDLEDRVERFTTRPLQEQPGSVWRYGPSLDVLARIVEIVSGEPFEDYIDRQILTPLKMFDTGFMPAPDERDNLATNYTYDGKGALKVSNDPPWDIDKRVSGSGSLVSTASDFMRFALMLWNKGCYDGVCILSASSVDAMTQLHVKEGVLSNAGIDGLGWGLSLSVVADSTRTAFAARDGDYWWSGYYGTQFWVSPKEGLVIVFIQQHEPRDEYRPEPGQEIPFVVQELLFRAL